MFITPPLAGNGVALKIVSGGDHWNSIPTIPKSNFRLGIPGGRQWKANLWLYLGSWALAARSRSRDVKFRSPFSDSEIANSEIESPAVIVSALPQPIILQEIVDSAVIYGGMAGLLASELTPVHGGGQFFLSVLKVSIGSRAPTVA